MAKKICSDLDGKYAGLGMAGFIIFPILIQPDATLD